MSSLLYFAYGSNMSTLRLRERVPSAQPLCVARLLNHGLKFHKRSQDGSAKCDIAQSDHPDDLVYGVVFELPGSEKPALDHAEGLGQGYEQKTVTVVKGNTETLSAFTYYATRIDAALQPYHWYKEHVLRGAIEHRLPAEYINRLKAIASIADPDSTRNERELVIYL